MTDIENNKKSQLMLMGRATASV